MKITSVTYGKTHSYESEYGNVRIIYTADVEEGESPDAVLDQLKKKIDCELKKADPDYIPDDEEQIVKDIIEFVECIAIDDTPELTADTKSAHAAYVKYMVDLNFRYRWREGFDSLVENHIVEISNAMYK